MKKYFLLFLFHFFVLSSFGQERPVLVFDLVAGTVDSIPIVDYDPSVESDFTNFYTGNFDTNVAVLEETLPDGNTYPNSQFTYKKRAAIDFDIMQYPIRTSVKLFSVVNDTLIDLCSGSLISRRHVLTAAHCLANFNSNDLNIDSILVGRVYNNGIFNSVFGSGFATKAYIFRDWSIGTMDLAVLELQEPVGESTGWLGIGFNNDADDLLDGIYYKFTYPATTILPIDPNEYNGDTLYYNYGGVDLLTNTSIAIANTSGIPGESGSSIIHIANNEAYTSYGVLSLSSNLNHCRIRNWQFYALKNIIAGDLVITSTPENETAEILTYPNPVTDVLHVKNSMGFGMKECLLLDNCGQQIRSLTTLDAEIEMDVSDLPGGLYYVKVIADSHISTAKIVKQ